MDLLGLAEIATLFGVTKQVVGNWRARRIDFPDPIAKLRSGPVWQKADIVAWAEAEGIPILVEPEETASDAAQSVSRRAIIAALMNPKAGVGKSTMSANFGWFAAFHRNY